MIPHATISCGQPAVDSDDYPLVICENCSNPATVRVCTVGDEELTIDPDDSIPLCDGCAVLNFVALLTTTNEPEHIVHNGKFDASLILGNEGKSMLSSRPDHPNPIN